MTIWGYYSFIKIEKVILRNNIYPGEANAIKMLEFQT